MLLKLLSWFQFHIGSIQAKYTLFQIQILQDEFQFHIGSIQARYPMTVSSKPKWFQFHIGSIQARPQNNRLDKPLHRFNSTLVRFKRTTVMDAVWSTRVSFNSTLVRFKQARPPLLPGQRFQFQFHIGSIQAGRRDRAGAQLRCFNSTLVRFKHPVTGSIHQLIKCFNSTLVRFKLIVPKSYYSLIR